MLFLRFRTSKANFSSSLRRPGVATKAQYGRRLGEREFAQVRDIEVKWEGEEMERAVGKNVFGQPLRLHSTKPLTGFTRTGYCEVPRSDTGNHSVAGSLSPSLIPSPSCSSFPYSGISLLHVHGHIHAHHPKEKLTRTHPPTTAILTTEFLDFSAARGNDLRRAGLTEGCKWCLCVSRWREAFEARTGADDRKVPRVVLGATNERALEGVRLEELKGFAVDGEEG
ncbi:hypothetical protein J1614_009824, partial [Plenodomus biglobosus]